MNRSDALSGAELRQRDVAFQAQLYAAENPTRRWLHTARRDWVMQAIDSALPAPSPQVLEVGVGAGLFTRHLSARSCQVLAVDVNPIFLCAVADLPGVEVREADVATLEAADFDLVVCSEVLEHLPPVDSGPALQRMYNALRPGGILVLTTPQAYSTMEVFARLLSNRLALALAKRLYGPVDDLGHINRLTRRALRRQFGQVGFHEVSQHLHGLYLPGVAEFGGQAGQKLAAALATVLRRIPMLSWLLWTQCYVLQRPT